MTAPLTIGIDDLAARLDGVVPDVFQYPAFH